MVMEDPQQGALLCNVHLLLGCSNFLVQLKIVQFPFAVKSPCCSYYSNIGLYLRIISKMGCSTKLQVTEVVAREEYKVKGNSARKLWPLEKKCPACRDSVGDILDWDDEAVYFYLMDFYRPFPHDGVLGENQLSEVQTVEKSVGVPYWTAGSIALASCGFGFATFYLRAFTQKYKYPLASPLLLFTLACAFYNLSRNC